MKQTRLNSVLGWIAVALLVAAAAPLPVAAADAGVAKDPAAVEIEELARTYFRYLGEFDFESMWDMSTPEFVMFEHDGTRAMRMDLKAFDERLHGAQEAGAQIRYEPGDFHTTVTPSAAWTVYVERGQIPTNQDRRFYGTMIFKRVDDRWLLDKMVSMPIPAGSPNFPE